MNILPGMLCLSPAEARDRYYVFRRAQHRPIQWRPALWRTRHGYTFSVSAAGYEANVRQGYQLVEMIRDEQ